MSKSQNVSDDVNLEQLTEFVADAAANPEAVQLGLGARAVYEGTCAHSLAHIDRFDLGGETIHRESREYTIPFGAWKEVLEAAGWEGAIDRMEPTEVALSALASCINVGITINAVANGVKIDSLETRVSTDFDPGVLFGLQELQESDRVFENMTAEITIESDDIEKDQIDEWARRAPVYTLTSLEQDLELNIETRTPVPADD